VARNNDEASFRGRCIPLPGGETAYISHHIHSILLTSTRSPSRGQDRPSHRRNSILNKHSRLQPQLQSLQRSRCWGFLQWQLQVVIRGPDTPSSTGKRFRHMFCGESAGDKQSSPQTGLLPRKIRELKGTSGFAFGYMPILPPLWVSVEQKYKDSCTANAGGVGLEFIWELFFASLPLQRSGVFSEDIPTRQVSCLVKEFHFPFSKRGLVGLLRGQCKFGGSREAMMFNWLIGWEPGRSFCALLSSCYQRAVLRSNCGGAQCSMCIFYDHFRPCSMTLAFFAACDSQHFRDGILGLSTVSKTPTTQIIHTSNRDSDDTRKHTHK
jgi:hypothetical protein